MHAQCREHSPDAAKAFWNAVVQKVIPGKASDVGGRRIPTQILFMVPLGWFIGNRRTFNENNQFSEIMKTTCYYDALIVAWYLNQHQAQGITTGHLYFPNCSSKSFSHGLHHPAYVITYDEKVALKPNVFDLRALIFDNSSVLQKIPKYY